MAKLPLKAKVTINRVKEIEPKGGPSVKPGKSKNKAKNKTTKKKQPKKKSK